MIVPPAIGYRFPAPSKTAATFATEAFARPSATSTRTRLSSVSGAVPIVVPR